MADHASTFLLVTILVLITVVLLFGMKFFSASRQAMFRAAGDDSVRQLAEKSALAQAESAASLAVVQSDVAEVKTRLAAIEKLLREVG
jgi:Tfp pilus assembly protein PilO